MQLYRNVCLQHMNYSYGWHFSTEMWLRDLLHCQFLFFLAVQHGLLDLSSPTRDWTQPTTMKAQNPDIRQLPQNPKHKTIM